MKKAVGISLFIFWTIIVALAAGAFGERQGQRNRFGQSGNQPSGQNQSAGVAPGTKLTIEEVAKHKTKEDCWMIVGGKVYALSGAIASHPGGANDILKFCGQDGTNAFATKDRPNGRDHSTRAYEMLKDYYLGDVGQILNSISQPVATSTSQTPFVQPQTVVPVVTKPTNITLDMAEVKKHNTAKDCWMVIKGNVYSLSGAITAHPGGASAIIKHCGQDGTTAFATKDYGNDHSGAAYAMLKPYLIGKLGQTLGSVPKPIVTPPPVPNQPSQTQTPTQPTVTGDITLTAAEVAKHNSATDCWMSISGKVYDVTSSIASHPGGASAEIRHCGTDATTAFATKDYGNNHSGGAYASLANYLIGTLGQTLSSTQINANVSQAATAPAPSGEDEDEDED